MSTPRAVRPDRGRRSNECSTLADLLDRHARRRPSAAALQAPGAAPLSYSDLRQEAAAIVARLRHLGISNSDRVAIALPKGLPAAVTFLGVACGAAAVPLNPAYRQAEFERYLKALDARLLVHCEGLPEAARAADGLKIARWETPPNEIRPASAVGNAPKAEAADWAGPDDTALVLQTSGSTARPKGVPLTQRNLLASAANIARALGLSEEDAGLDIMPLFHVHGLVVSLLAGLVRGGSVVCPPTFSPQGFSRWLAEFQPSWYSAAPTLHQAVVEQFQSKPDRAAVGRLRLIRSSAAPLPAVLRRALEETFAVPVVEGYGMSECPQISCGPLDGRQRPGAVGWPAGPEVRIVGDDGQDVADGMTGEVIVRDADCLFGGYDDDDETAAAFDGDWFRSGDLARFGSDGQLEIVGRVKEMINRGGEKLAPREIEGVLLAHPDVSEAVVFPQPHPRLGEVPAAAVITQDGAVAADELRHHVSLTLAEHKIPTVIHLVDTIPLGPSGKLDRMRLAEQLTQNDRPPGGGEPPADELESFLARLWRQVLRLETVDRHTDFFEVGGDSVLAAQVLVRVRDRFPLELPLRLFFEEPTLAGLAGVIRQGQTSEMTSGESQPVPDPGPPAARTAGPETAAEPQSSDSGSGEGVALSLFFFSAEQPGRQENAYRLLLETSRFADRAGFEAVWTPERHFTVFGGPYPNPSVLGAALAASTERIQIRAGSVVLPLHDVIRIAEEWAVVDNLSGGRVGIACASGWHSNDFVLAPEAYPARKQKMFEQLELLQRLWRGETVTRESGDQAAVEISTLPRPVQSSLPVWLAAHSDETFEAAGRLGLNILTTLYNTTPQALAHQIGLYRRSLARSGRHPSAGRVTLMVHAFVGDDRAEVEAEVGAAYGRYLERSLSQQEGAGWAFPTRAGARSSALADFELSEADRRDIIGRATREMLDGSGLVGTVDQCRRKLRDFESLGVDEVACLIDFGVGLESVMSSLERLAALLSDGRFTDLAETVDS